MQLQDVGQPHLRMFKKSVSRQGKRILNTENAMLNR